MTVKRLLSDKIVQLSSDLNRIKIKCMRPCVESIYYFLLTTNDSYDFVLFQISSKMYPIFGENLIITWQTSRYRHETVKLCYLGTKTIESCSMDGMIPTKHRNCFQTDARNLFFANYIFHNIFEAQKSLIL